MKSPPLAGIQAFVVLTLAVVSPLAARDTLYQSPGNLEYGVHGPAGRLLDKGCYVVNYCDEWRVPYWSAYYISRDTLKKDRPRRRLEKHFQPDTLVPKEFRSVKADYKSSGFDRGHMAPAADFKRRLKTYVATFLLSNMSPQRDSANRRVCARIEDSLRRVVKQSGEAWIVVGNAMMDSTGRRLDTAPGSNWIRREKAGELQKRVAVPTHLFRAALVRDDEGYWQAWAFLVPNTSKLAAGWSIGDYQLSVDSLEKLTGWDFFIKLDSAVQAKVEAEEPE